MIRPPAGSDKRVFQPVCPQMTRQPRFRLPGLEFVNGTDTHQFAVDTVLLWLHSPGTYTQFLAHAVNDHICL